MHGFPKHTYTFEVIKISYNGIYTNSACARDSVLSESQFADNPRLAYVSSAGNIASN